ncbi:MAG: sigma 54-interacting transcriptional regulator [Candidatus Krumholzibacteriia bacterium]
MQRPRAGSEPQTPPRPDGADIEDVPAVRPATTGTAAAAPAAAPTPDLIERMFHSTADGVYAVDERRRIVAINEAALHLLDITREQALGRPCHEVLRLNVCRESCALSAARTSGQPIVNLAVDLLRRDGLRTPALLSSAIMHDDAGRPIGGVETLRGVGSVPGTGGTLERGEPLDALFTNSGQLQNLVALLPTIAASDSCVLITGETGTGKGLVARAIHDLSPRRNGPFVTLECAALPEDLLEPELFGCGADAYIGATRERTGRIARAEGGTLYLDEIGAMPLPAQVKLLRVLQDRLYERSGDVQPVEADVRVMAASSADLARSVDEGRFRSDLYYRVNVLSVDLPPLRDRRTDVPLLVDRFLARLRARHGKQVGGVTAPVLDLLQGLDYPGNVRELENIVEHAYVLCNGPVVDLQHLPPRVHGSLRSGGERRRASLAEAEARFLRDELARHGWNRQATADALGIHRTTLLRRIQRLKLRLPARDGRARPRRVKPAAKSPRR